MKQKMVQKEIWQPAQMTSREIFANTFANNTNIGQRYKTEEVREILAN